MRTDENGRNKQYEGDGDGDGDDMMAINDLYAETTPSKTIYTTNRN